MDSRHRRFYPTRNHVKVINKFSVRSGMIVEFKYKSTKTAKTSRPLVFVMDTDEATSGDKKNFSGINLNYMPAGVIEKFFSAVGTKVGWELDKDSGFPKLDIFEEDDTGVKPQTLYKPFVKSKVLNKYDCWRTYKYKTVATVKVIKFEFTTDTVRKAIEEIYKPATELQIGEKSNELERKIDEPKKPKQAKKPKQPEKPEQPKKPNQPPKGPSAKGGKSNEGEIGKTFLEKLLGDMD